MKALLRDELRFKICEVPIPREVDVVVWGDSTYLRTPDLDEVVLGPLAYVDTPHLVLETETWDLTRPVYPDLVIWKDDVYLRSEDRGYEKITHHVYESTASMNIRFFLGDEEGGGDS